MVFFLGNQAMLDDAPLDVVYFIKKAGIAWGILPTKHGQPGLPTSYEMGIEDKRTVYGECIYRLIPRA